MEAPDPQRKPDGEAIDDPAAPLALLAVRAADDRKALDITALRVSHLTSATSFFINLSGRSKAQMNAIVKSIEDEVLEEYGRRPHRQGKALGGWVCLDFDSVVVNVFSEDQRDFYGIDKFWAAAQVLDISKVITPNTPDASSSAATDDDLDDWELGEDDDWSLGLDDDWSLDGADEGASGFGAVEEASEEEEEEAVGAEPEAIAWDDHPDNPKRGQSAEESEEAPVAFDFSVEEAAVLDGDDEDDLFAAFATEAAPVVEQAEATIATAEDEEADERRIEQELKKSGLLVEVDGDDDDEDWAMGDAKLRALVEQAERQSKGGAAGDGVEGGEDAAGEEPAWRKMMAEDGWEDVEDTIEAAIMAAEDESEDGFFE